MTHEKVVDKNNKLVTFMMPVGHGHFVPLNSSLLCTTWPIYISYLGQ